MFLLPSCFKQITWQSSQMEIQLWSTVRKILSRYYLKVRTFAVLSLDCSTKNVDLNITAVLQKHFFVFVCLMSNVQMKPLKRWPLWLPGDLQVTLSPLQEHSALIEWKHKQIYWLKKKLSQWKKKSVDVSFTRFQTFILTVNFDSADSSSVLGDHPHGLWPHRRPLSQERSR